MDMETKICKACGIEKSIDSYYNCKACQGGKASTCKVCKIQGKLVVKDKPHPFNLAFKRSEIHHYSLAGCTPNDYALMWELLSKIGYDCGNDIHQQFLDKMKFNYEVDMKYKKKKHTTTFDKDGNQIKNPQSDE